MLQHLLHWRRGWWRRLNREARAGVVFVCIEAVLVAIVVIASVAK